MLNNETIENDVLDNFAATGELARHSTECEEMICNCMFVTRAQIKGFVERGITNFDALSKETGAGTVCGSCRYGILEMAGESPWTAATMQKTIQHNDHVNSYFIEPINTAFKKFSPGQHIVIQAKVGGNWVERCYMVSDLPEENEPLRVTIKKEVTGLFSKWLFEEAPEKISVNVTQPQGDFILNIDAKTPALCFADDIGITPFIAYLKQLLLTRSSKRIHIIYSAIAKEDFIFKDELNQILQAMPTVSMNYRETKYDGVLSNNEIVNFVKSLSDPDIYVCGPEGFEQMICQSLRSLNLNQKKIHIEPFFHTG